MDTKPLYLTDAYKKTSKAKVVDIKNEGHLTTVILDQTIFYPFGGGQPSDQGVIEGKKGKLDVQQVLLKGSELKHTGKLTGKLSVGDTVECAIDWKRRYFNMRNHSGGHLIHEAVKLIFPDLIAVEGEHGKKSYIKYQGNIEDISSNIILSKTKELIRQNLPINTEFVSLEELKKRSSWVPEHLPTNKPLRIMWIGNFAPIPDGGTQVNNTSEIEDIESVQIVSDNEFSYVHYKIISNNQNATKPDGFEISENSSSESREYLINLKNQAIAQITEAKSLEELESLRIDLFGRSGKFTLASKEIKNVADGDKKQYGITLNEVKSTLDELVQSKRNDLKVIIREWFDPSIPVKNLKIGHMHPTSVVISEMTEIFKNMGFSITEGPEIETDHYNFELLNLPKDHPARSLQDVLYIEEPEVLLRSHTSSVETRSIEKLKPPFRVVVAGKCYRFENVNASNNAMFYQFQGFALQVGLSMADLKGTLVSFVKSYFGEDRKIRYRCKYYPEVEPGVGLDIDCKFCNQKGCSVCKGRGWIEMLGAGMIHPNILKNFGYDPKKISGFAFGMGLDRIVMDRFKINDIRSLYNGDIKY